MRLIDRQNKIVQIKLPNGATRTAKYLGDQGYVTLPTETICPVSRDCGDDSVGDFSDRLPELNE